METRSIMINGIVTVRPQTKISSKFCPNIIIIIIIITMIITIIKTLAKILTNWTSSLQAKTHKKAKEKTKKYSSDDDLRERKTILKIKQYSNQIFISAQLFFLIVHKSNSIHSKKWTSLKQITKLTFYN